MKIIIAFLGLMTVVHAQYRYPYNQEYYGRRVAILRQNQNQDIDGSYAFSYDTENGISVAEQGTPTIGPSGPAEIVRGQYSYTAPDGTPIVVQYTAGPDGFQASGNHLPTPPPVNIIYFIICLFILAIGIYYLFI
ncbi:hypothetical protein HCN44_003911 [Aphidius gifuensis]|uniref:Cuticular protein n=1 Tax=Aphidius gifuensis TaxID=684658 RepID=A0A835CRZ6_APHGI|nr:hypothetical protein HCN44_003911 [Aphidius gifuensis]